MLIYEYSLTRRDMQSALKRFWRYEQNFITLYPVDENQPRLGGKVKVVSLIMDWHTFTPQYKTLYGIYGDDFITYGEFRKDIANPLNEEEILIRIADENDTDTVLDKTTFTFRDNKLSYRRDVNGEQKDTEIEHSITESSL